MDITEVERHKIRLIVAGSRTITDGNLLEYLADDILNVREKDNEVIIIEGGAKGADFLGYQYARDRGYDRHRERADWDRYGRSAGYIRNSTMADMGTHLIALWDGESRGTKHMIDLALKKDLKVHVITLKD